MRVHPVSSINQIKAQIEETTSDYDREKLQERLAKLAVGVEPSPILSSEARRKPRPFSMPDARYDIEL